MWCYVNYQEGNYQCARDGQQLLFPLHYVSTFYLESSTIFIHFYKLCSEVLVGSSFFQDKIQCNKNLVKIRWILDHGA